MLQHTQILKVLLIAVFMATQQVVAQESFSAECLVDSPF